MKLQYKIGIIGGMGTLAGLSLLQRINELSLQYVEKDQDFIEFFYHNNSNIYDRTQSILAKNDTILDQLSSSIDYLNYCGVDLTVVGCMTAHHYYQHMIEKSNSEILNPLSLIKKELLLKYNHIKTVGLVGSTGLLESKIVQDELLKIGSRTITLNKKENEKYFMKPIFEGVKIGKKNKELIKDFYTQFEILKDRGADLVIGACSEIPLIVNNGNPLDMDIDYVDVFELVARKIVNFCYV